MPLLVDAYNVLHTVGVLPPELAGIDIPGLVQLIQSSRYHSERVDLICDGAARPEVPPGRRDMVNVRYAGPGQEADAMIAQLVKHSTAPRRLIVVSSDQAVLRTARKRKCRTLTSPQFLHQLASDAQVGSGGGSHAAAGSRVDQQPTGGLTDRQIEAWLSIFGVCEDEVEQDPDSDTQPHAQSNDREGAQQGRKSPKPKRKRTKHPQKRGRYDAPLPSDLIREAEELWRRESSVNPKDVPTDVDSGDGARDNA